MVTANNDRYDIPSKIDVIRKLATAAGDVPMLRQGYRLVLMGITTVSEIQRVMKDK